jgi:AhpD family alkylhydroperoxidase
MTGGFPTARMDLTELASKPSAAMRRFDASIELDGALRELVKLRASQINGCAFCIDMHWKDARAAGESEQRLYSLGAWRGSPLYSARERAALALCEAITLITDGHVRDAVWDAADAVFTQDELAQLVFAVTSINAWNRLAIATRMEPGHYNPATASAARSR